MRVRPFNQDTIKQAMTRISKQSPATARQNYHSEVGGEMKP